MGSAIVDTSADTSAERPGAALLLGAVLLLAALLRLGAFALFAETTTARGDEVYYVAQARALVEHATYPGALRPPGESALIALVFLLFGESLVAARLVQVVVSLLTIALVFDVTRRRLGSRAAVAAGLLCALDPTLLHYAHLLWSENLYGLLLVATVWCLERFDRLGATRWLVGACVSLGLAALTRETAFYFAPVGAVWLWAGRSGSRATRLRPALLFVLVTCATVAPWVVRNSLTYGAFVSLSTNRWRMIAQGNVSTELVPRLRARSGEDFAYRGHRRPIDRERIARGLAVDAILARQPWWLLEKIRQSTRKLIVTKSQLARYVKRRWLAPRVVPVARVLVSVERMALALIVASGVAGLWLAGAPALQTLLAALIATHWAIYVLAFAHNRFLVPLLPLLAIVAGPLLTRWPPWRGARSWQLAGAATSLLALGALVVAG
ncbi:MAG: glycosyltransferase family 39 protein [Deltaproteobacteria bacterium]|nr:glycosyltransferase family 39 protein [Deltaproteobacteria bacterium]